MVVGAGGGALLPGEEEEARQGSTGDAIPESRADEPSGLESYLIHFFWRFDRFFLEISCTFHRKFLSVLRSEVAVSDGATFLY
jgi:hypothetical protein